jgi:hypothetical protein
MKMEQAIRAIQDMDNEHSFCSFSASYASYFCPVVFSCSIN